jgi:hypothetical protein
MFTSFGPAAGAYEGPIDCGFRDGRERLTTQGFQATFDAPPVTYHASWEASSAQFYFTPDLAPYAAATVNIKITWTDARNDYDLFVYDGKGKEIGASYESDTNFEQVILGLDQCQDIQVETNNYQGLPDQPITLAVTVEGDSSRMLACSADDPTPGCAGKAAGEAPDLVPDTRARLYLGGDPGQVSMVHAFAGNDSLPKGRLESTRPTGGRPNQYTRPVAGFRDQWQNPFLAHWKTALEQPRLISGQANVLLWVSSATEDATGTLYVDLYADDALVGQATVKGDQLTPTPAPLFVTVPIPEAIEATSTVGLQVGTNPAIASSGPGNPRDAHVTLFYGSVQFPARVTLP